MINIMKKSLKERYKDHRKKCYEVVADIEKHDPKMAQSARQLLSVDENSTFDKEFSNIKMDD